MEEGSGRSPPAEKKKSYESDFFVAFVDLDFEQNRGRLLIGRGTREGLKSPPQANPHCFWGF